MTIPTPAVETTADLFFATVRLVDAGGDTDTSATGFLVADDDGRPVVVTNRHCVVDRDRLTITLIAGDDDGEPRLGVGRELAVPDLGDRAVLHPNPDVDVAAVPVEDVLDAVSGRIYARYLQREQLHRPGVGPNLEAIEDVLVLGYPNGLRDEAHLTPIARRGITATPAVLDYDGRPVFLIDGSIFPGSSGSPVVRRLVSSDGPPGIELLGMVAQAKGRPAEALEGDQSRPVEMIDLGVVFKAHLIHDLVGSTYTERP